MGGQRRRLPHFRFIPKADVDAESLEVQRSAMYGRRPRCKEESDLSAKRSGAAMLGWTAPLPQVAA
jgi:hypothetical protein